MARRAFESPWPPPMATTRRARPARPARPARRARGARGSGTVEVTMTDPGLEAEIVEDASELVRDHDAAVAATGAADTDGEVCLALVDVRGQEEREQPPQLVEERLRLGLVHHVLLYPRVGSRQRTQLV